jgi:RNA polymerase sigma-70 factor (ECF subfamily)
MTRPGDDLLATRRSLLARLKNADDQTGWHQFFDTYWKLLYGVAIKTGLTEPEAEDAVQETVIAVAKHMPQFQYDPNRCSFKSWLMLLARQRIVHQFRKRRKVGQASSLANANPSEDLTEADVDQLPDPAGPQLETIWNEEWEKHVFSSALEAVKQHVTDRQLQIFDLYVLQNWPVAEVTRTLRVSATQVYLAKHRVGRLLKKELQRLQRELK